MFRDFGFSGFRKFLARREQNQALATIDACAAGPG
jgi:hypothetical protein